MFYMFENFGKGKENDSVTWRPAAKLIALWNSSSDILTKTTLLLALNYIV